MQRRYSEPNTYTDSPPSDPQTCDDIYDDVASIDNEQEVGKENFPPCTQLCLFWVIEQKLHLSDLPEIISEQEVIGMTVDFCNLRLFSFNKIRSVRLQEVQEDQDSSFELTANTEQNEKDRIYLDLIPVRSFLHTSPGRVSPQTESSPQAEHPHPVKEVSDVYYFIHLWMIIVYA